MGQVAAGPFCLVWVGQYAKKSPDLQPKACNANSTIRGSALLELTGQKMLGLTAAVFAFGFF
jgi:hypothetical protein